MKRFLIIGFLNLCIHSNSQSIHFKDMVSGFAFTFNEVWEVYPKTKIQIENTANGTNIREYCVVMNDNKDSWCTVVGAKINENFAVIFGYAPGVSNKLFNNYGEFYLYYRKNGEIVEVKHLYEPLTKFAENNTSKEYLKKDGITVVINEKFEVEYFEFDFTNRIYFLPKNYFEYK